jgi:hypothetical protein
LDPTLRTIVRFLLGAFPASCMGPQHVSIYNDAYRLRAT